MPSITPPVTNRCLIPLKQMERDDRATEVDILKEKLEKAQAQVTRAQDEKETANREFERALEKCDKYAVPFLSFVCMICDCYIITLV